MTAPPDDTTTDTSAIIAALRAERDAALAEKAALAEALATRTAELLERNSKFDERIEYEAATVGVLKAMSASPSDTLPVFNLITRRAAELCESSAALYELKEGQLNYMAGHGMDSEALAAFRQSFPQPLDRSLVVGRAILERRIVHVQNVAADTALLQVVRDLGGTAIVAIPLLRDGGPIGAIALNGRQPGGFSESQIALLQTFAEQAAIAISSAETYRALQERTAALAQRNSEYGERIEQQAATIDVLKVMSSSPGNAQPVFDLIVERARAFCGADQCTVALLDGDMLHLKALAGWSEASARNYAAQFPRPVNTASMFGRAILAREAVQTPDVSADPEHFSRTRVGGPEFRAIVAVPMLRAGTPIGAIGLGRKMPGVYSATQMELLRTFAEQAVIAITSAETYRALQTRTADLQETLEYQTATSDVLKVISRSTFDLQPVLETLVETAARLCDADQAVIAHPEGDLWRLRANFGFPPEYEAYQRERGLYSLDPHAPNVSARAVRERRPVHIHDVAEVPGYPEIFIRLAKQRSSLGVPLLREGEAIGYIVLARQRVEPFTDRQIELVSTFADQAVIAIENTRLITEQREALEQQTATAEVLQIINSSPGDLAPVFEAMLDKAIRLCEAAHGHLLTYDGECFHLAAASREPHYVEWQRQVGAVRPGPSAPLGRISRGERIVHIADLREEEVYRTSPAFREQADIRGARSQITVGLFKDNTLLGAMIVYRQEVRPFSDKQIALLENFAAQAVIAMENARLITEQREALEQQTATAEVLEVINASPGELAPVFDTVLDKAMHLCEAGFSMLHLRDGEQFRAVAQRGVPAAYAEFRAKNPLPNRAGGPLARLLITKRPEHIPDLMQEDVYKLGTLSNRALVDIGGGRTVVYVPLIRGDAVLGVIAIYRQEVRPFTDKQIALLENFAAQAVIAMENARLLGELRTALDTTQAAFRDLKTAQTNLIQAEKMASLGQLTAGIAHEIKNPLNFVNNFSALSTELIDELRDVLAPEPLGETARTEVDDLTALLKGNLEKVVQHGQRADGIVRSMLDHSRGSSGERRMIDLNALIDEALNLAYHGARAQDQSFNITLERDFGAGLAPIEVNPQDITRVFLNLFANGFYAVTRRAREGGDAGFEPMLKVTTIDAGEAVEIRVRDNGTGIPADIRDKLFQPFFTTKPTGEGTGLGLSITYDIVTAQHGGDIVVDSNVGKYSEFTIRLPRSP